ncbi:UDP-glucuronate 4-epimerase [Pseudomonas grimontii]|uniref:NAD-dependent epimerase n=1 Tax=Pseudomonas grimontii TaxID=129847 RepID=A0A1H1E2U9_9PSED|nr:MULTISPECIES: NAD-dependent epimerase [Pseudomonas]ETK23932.1 NAD-dependent epimerase/dehydratase [Pseudomonas sp. FH1]TWR68175.1 NAD-dependent epimerase [Pseudomonas grimontii]SDQ82930.1 UDP-glucuronate 4-epimerase [Pseudomonas grimontii]
MTVLVTGVAGFIGFHVARRLCEQGIEVVGIDNLNAYYSVELKQARLAQLKELPSFTFHRLDITDAKGLSTLFERHDFEQVIHLAAQAGVRYSLEEPGAYAQSNLVGFVNILEACRHHRPAHLIYASSSSVYGANTCMPFRVEDAVDRPLSLYAATKRANELSAYSYSHLYGLRASGLRFFTVYGPWGRPDMALFKFTRAMLAGEPVDIYNHGEMARDFTYIDDIVESILRLRLRPPEAVDSEPAHQIFNIGRGQPVKLLEFVDCLEAALGLRAERRYLPMQAGDVPQTWADVTALTRWIDFQPQVSVDTGVQAFVDWYREHYQPRICPSSSAPRR